MGKLNDRYHRPSAAQALNVIEQLLEALGLPHGSIQPQMAVPQTSTDSSDLSSWFNSVKDLGTLPHLDLDELFRTLDMRLDSVPWGPLV